MFIREALKTDVSTICRLQRQSFEENSIYGFVPETREEIEKSINPYFLVAENDDGIIGFVAGKNLH